MLIIGEFLNRVQAFVNTFALPLIILVVLLLVLLFCTTVLKIKLEQLIKVFGFLAIIGFIGTLLISYFWHPQAAFIFGFPAAIFLTITIILSLFWLIKTLFFKKNT